MSRTQPERLWLGGGVAAALLIVVIGYFFLISPQRSRTASVDDQVSSAQLQATTLQTRIASLTSEQKRLPSYRQALAAARAALPSAGDVSATPAMLRSLQRIAAQTSVTVSTLTVGDPAAVAAPVPTTEASSPAAGSSAATPSAAATPAASLYSIALSASAHGTAAHLGAFLHQLQHAESRALLINAITLGGTQSAPAGSTGGFTLTLTMTAYVLPPAGAAPVGTGVPGAVTTTSTP